MAITYNWTIPTCEHDIAEGGITVAHWRVSAVDAIALISNPPASEDEE